MVIDAALRFSNAQAITATAVSTEYIDFGVARDMGIGENLHVVILVSTAFTDSGSDSTVTVTLETDDNSSFSSATVAMTIGTFAALSAIGSRLVARLQPLKVNERYARLNYTLANGNLTTGALTAFVLSDVDLALLYPDAITIV